MRSKFSFSGTVVEVYASQPYAIEGLIIAEYSLALVLFENSFHFKNLYKAKNALSVFLLVS